MEKILPLVPALLEWFDREARDLPWRRTLDPYAIWISEIMLQQTQVRTVIPYWERWMAALPDVHSLAVARLDQVLKLWEGLGYYTRARHLHNAARLVAEKHDGKFPQAFEAVLALPGIGRYTAGAICSIAFDQPTPILDGNVMRVLTRLFAISGDPRQAPANAALWHRAEALVRQAAALQPGSRACARFNQALMELGATICTPRAPQCPDCPAEKFCAARRQDRVSQFPELSPRAPTVAKSFAAFVVQRGGRYLVRQREAGVVNAHLWEFPNLELTPPRVRLGAAAAHCLGAKPARLRLLGEIRHVITRSQITLRIYLVSTVNPVCALPRKAGWRWESLAQLDQRAFPSAHRQILNILRKQANSGPARPLPKSTARSKGGNFKKPEDSEDRCKPTMKGGKKDSGSRRQGGGGGEPR